MHTLSQLGTFGDVIGIANGQPGKATSERRLPIYAFIKPIAPSFEIVSAKVAMIGR